MNPQKIKNLFLRQSYRDAWMDYENSLTKTYFIKWDYVILTASNEEQAKAYRMQIDYRRRQRLLPESTHFAVLPDPDGKRVGSGGATFHVMKYIREQSNTGDCFTNQRILVIHSGGDSKRVPQYSACGKLFSPVPRVLPNGRRSTLFDEFMISMSGMPARIQDGMLILSGDVLLLFNPLQIDLQFHGAAAISIKENVQTGKNHGVFFSDADGNVGDFLHKMTVEQLEVMGAVNEHGNVDLDTGAIMLDRDLLTDLFTLISTDGANDPVKYERFVNETARLSFYGDFLFPLASRSTKEQYMREHPEGSFCSQLTRCREDLWRVLHGFRLKLLCLSPAEFIHFGTTRELLGLVAEDIDNYEFLDWKAFVGSKADQRGDFACSNSFIEAAATVLDGSYIEDSYLLGSTLIGRRCVISHMQLRNRTVPDGTVLHGVRLKSGEYVVRVYGTDDNPKGTLEDQTCYLGIGLLEFLARGKLKSSDLWETEHHFLWTAKLYPVCSTMEEAVTWALWLCRTASGEVLDNTEYLKLPRKSLYESFNEADVLAVIPWQTELGSKIRVQSFIDAIESGAGIEKAKSVFGMEGISGPQMDSLLETAKSAGLGTKMRIYYYLSKMVEGKQNEDLETSCFQSIRDSIYEAMVSDLSYGNVFKIRKEEVKVELPVRINFGGGWSDTPPYCNEHGGTVLNAAIKLNGILPVVVHVKRWNSTGIVLASTDSGAQKEFASVRELQNCYNPFDTFALHKAALIACGIIPLEQEISMEEIVSRLGGGLYLSTAVIGIPRGSGLGTSSILAGACVKGIYEFTGQEISDNELYTRVMCMEQIMSTGGGWQDQAGGLTNGIKLCTTKPGMIQSVQVKHLNLSKTALGELQSRLALIYTGQRRLARNLLREVVGGYIGSNPNSLEVLYEIQRSAVLMEFELEKGNIDAFAELLDRHWTLSQRLDQGCTNTCIDQIFMTCEDMLAGKMICGAGGGGFLQVILKRGYTKEDLRDRIKTVFQDSGVDVWSCELI